MRDKRLDNRATTPEELLLIRVGHHLWREYKSKNAVGWPKEVLSQALDSVWEAKRSLRAILRRSWLESYKNRISQSSARMREYHGRNAKSS